MKVPLKKKDWSSDRRRAMTATELVTHLAKLEGWCLAGDGPDLAIEKTFSFINYYFLDILQSKFGSIEDLN